VKHFVLNSSPQQTLPQACQTAVQKFKALGVMLGAVNGTCLLGGVTSGPFLNDWLAINRHYTH
jgi:hypothetical protein